MTVATNGPARPAELVTQYQRDFAVVLPSHIKPETWCRVAIGALRQNPQLEQAAMNNPRAFLGALLDAARRGLEPGTEQYYLVPQKNKGRLEVRGQMGYQGVIELIYRAGAVSSVIVEAVREGDKFAYRPGRDEIPDHQIDWDSEDRGALRLVYAYARMKDGAYSKVVVLNKGDIKRAKESSQGSNSAYSPWKNHEEAMWLKTAAHRLAKWVPTSAEYMREQLRAVKDVEAEGPRPPRLGVVQDQPSFTGETKLEQVAELHPDGVDEQTGEIDFVDAELVDTDLPEEEW